MSQETKPKSRSRIKFIKYLIAACLMVGAILYLFFGPTAVRQWINPKKARAHKAELNKIFSGYPEFKHVEAVEFTGEGGCIMVKGWLEDQYSANRLRNIVIDSKPPLKVIYLLHENKTDRLLKIISEDK